MKMIGMFCKDIVGVYEFHDFVPKPLYDQEIACFGSCHTWNGTKFVLATICALDSTHPFKHYNKMTIIKIGVTKYIVFFALAKLHSNFLSKSQLGKQTSSCYLEVKMLWFNIVSSLSKISMCENNYTMKIKYLKINRPTWSYDGYRQLKKNVNEFAGKKKIPHISKQIQYSREQLKKKKKKFAETKPRI